MALFVIRHGQTKLNSMNVFNGRLDESLNETGIMQAKEAGKRLQQQKFDCIYCSPMLRARQTLENLNLDKSVPVIYDDRLIERDEGALNGQEITPDLLKNIYLNINNTTQVEGLESLTEVIGRVTSVLDEIAEKFAHKNVLIVSHRLIGRVIYYYFNGLPEDGFLTDPESGLDNCEFRTYEFNKTS